MKNKAKSSQNAHIATFFSSLKKKKKKKKGEEKKKTTLLIQKTKNTNRFPLIKISVPTNFMCLQ